MPRLALTLVLAALVVAASPFSRSSADEIVELRIVRAEAHTNVTLRVPGRENARAARRIVERALVAPRVVMNVHGAGDDARAFWQETLVFAVGVASRLDVGEVTIRGERLVVDGRARAEADLESLRADLSSPPAAFAAVEWSLLPPGRPWPDGVAGGRGAESEPDRVERDPPVTDGAGDDAMSGCEARARALLERDPVVFASGRAEPSPEARAGLAQLAEVLVGCAGGSIMIAGHTDSDGTTERNLELSYERASAVAAVLVAGGVRADSVAAVGFGESRPVADNETSEGRARNRRIEIAVGDAAETR